MYSLCCYNKFTLDSINSYIYSYVNISILKWSFSLLYQIKFLNPMISRKPKLQRQRKIFKQQVKNFPRAKQMNINVATWGRLLKRSSPSIQNARAHSESPPSVGECTNGQLSAGCFIYSHECTLGFVESCIDNINTSFTFL